jgi:Tol biopolymer transport system component
MPLSAGDRLGPYEILAPLGAGGMGEVYRAHDSRLKRDVAIKVLPAALALDPDRMVRFEREARLLASLDHPNIGAIYGLEESTGTRSLVLALIDGPTLADRIAAGPIPLEEAIPIAQQIAEALEYAHDRGVIHRDLKPANVKVTPAGAVKVLDFGLAKALTGESDTESGSPASSPTMSPTISMRETQMGMILGTAAYMAPEQAKGKTVDRRADIWAFGVVLFEMLTGKHLFTGDTAAEIMASAIKEEPKLDRLPASTPPAIRRLIERCLNKDPKQRLQAIGEARIVLGGPMEETGASSAPSRSRLSWVGWAVAGALALALIVAGVLLYNATRPAPLRPLIRVNINVDDSTPLARAGGSTPGNMMALSPDGSRLALTLRGADGTVRLHTRLLNQSRVTPLAGTDDASFPFFSPDGYWIGFFADGILKKISVEGGAAVTLCDAPGPRGAGWGEDGNIIAALSGTGGLSRVQSGGGTPVPVTKLGFGEVTHRWPQVLPGSQAILFTSSTVVSNPEDANIDVISLKSGEKKTVARGGFYARFLPSSSGAGPAGTGHLIYLHHSTLFAVPFDLGRLAATGSSTPVLEDVAGSTMAGGDFAFAQNGTFVYLSGKGTAAGYPISWVDNSGQTQQLHAPISLYYTPRFSPDGKRLAFALSNGHGSDIWVKDLDRDTLSRLSFLPDTNRGPVWTPDGKDIVFLSSNRAAPGIYWIHSDGSGEAQRLTSGKFQETPYSFSPDGKRLAFYQASGDGGSQEIFTALIEGDAAHPKLGKAELFQGTPFFKQHPAFSPDGRWLAYESNESGTYQVYVRPFPGPGGRWQISTGGGSFPVWSRDGRELLFETLDYRVMAASYTAKGDSFAAGKPRVWAETRLTNFGESNYDLAPDGKHLAAMVAGDASSDKPPTHLTFLLNFFDELRRRAPASK